MSAEAKGAKSSIKRVVKKALGGSIYREVVRSKHYVSHRRAVRKAGKPAKGLHVIGVTGTNGKTTTSTYLFEILRMAGYKVAVYTSTHYQIMDKVTKNSSITTSENIAPILSFYQECKKAGVTHVVQETTSQALHQWRVMGIPYEAAIMTNLTYEHMDYHVTMKKYAKAKAMLFKKKGIKYQVLNHDDEWFGFYDKIPALRRKLSYGVSDKSTAVIRDVVTTHKGTEFVLDFRLDHEVATIKLNQLGDYNVHNAAAAATMAHCYGVKPGTMSKALAQVKTLDGRLEPVVMGQPFAVFVDYAHTPDGITQIGKAVRAVTPGKTILVHSVYDGRDPKKWPMLGEAAAKSFDQCIVTDEEAEHLPLETMRNAIKEGYAKAGYKKFIEIPDRQEAIDKAVSLALAGDSVVIIPFGNLKQRSMYGREEVWDDRDASKRALAKLGFSKK